MPSSDTQFKPGVSGNPTGRTKGARNVASKVRLMTGDAMEMVDFHRARMRDESETYANRSSSCDWLMLWGYGNPDPVVEGDEGSGTVLPFNRPLGPPPEDE